jgi:hypothetical protein
MDEEVRRVEIAMYQPPVGVDHGQPRRAGPDEVADPACEGDVGTLEKTRRLEASFHEARHRIRAVFEGLAHGQAGQKAPRPGKDVPTDGRERSTDGCRGLGHRAFVARPFELAKRNALHEAHEDERAPALDPSRLGMENLGDGNGERPRAGPRGLVVAFLASGGRGHRLRQDAAVSVRPRPPIQGRAGALPVVDAAAFGDVCELVAE